ncbi:Heme d1 biosynthesis protein NirD / Heme d1 biosynthesis protein NirL [hydrothermal vent metagenome]|uniref:siroheme decarboxylase n=1 Tax=hydrothermal vent metagenome TaxID=652676 RepID=A0A3B1B3S7_9ZZZZ
MVLTEQDCRLISAIQGGMPLVSHPYAEVGRAIGMSEEQVIGRIDKMQEHGVIKRFGVVVRHHELGYKANAMVVWDVPDECLDELGESLGSQDCVTLCYQRPRRLPEWPYNLFCMIHGRSREKVLAQVEQMVDELGWGEIQHEVLFSGQRFKQRGARYQ